MQNKMHYAATGMTGPEILSRRADAGKANMGLTYWKGGRVLKRDVGTAKNYLNGNRSTVVPSYATFAREHTITPSERQTN